MIIDQLDIQNAFSSSHESACNKSIESYLSYGKPLFLAPDHSRAVILSLSGLLVGAVGDATLHTTQPETSDGLKISDNKPEITIRNWSYTKSGTILSAILGTQAVLVMGVLGKRASMKLTKCYHVQAAETAEAECR